MDNVYAFGLDIIVLLQKRFHDYEEFFMLVNKIADPHYALTHIFPFISIFNIFLASEFLLVVSVADWMNAVLKWILAEHRPFWWVRETEHYGPLRDNKPYLKLGSQTCETGPGSPSGHLMSASCILALFYYWLLMYINKREPNKRNISGILVKWCSRLVITVILVLISMGRLFIAAHFPHQCLIGIIIGFLTTHVVSNYWIRPFMRAEKDQQQINKYYMFNLGIALFTVAFSFGLYWTQKLFNIDPMWSVKLAFKRCPSPDYLHFNSTPFYALVESTGSILGWALCVTPTIDRLNKRERSLLVSGAAAAIFQGIFAYWQSSVSRDDAIYFYFIIYLFFVARPVFFMRVIPFIATIGQKSTKMVGEKLATNLGSPKLQILGKDKQ